MNSRIFLLQLLLCPAVLLLAQEKHDSTAKRLHLHQMDAEHSSDFDKEMLMGSEEASSLSGMKREDAERRLGQLFDKNIDTNADGKASRQELVKWMSDVADSQLQRDTDKQWLKLNVSGDLLDWAAAAASELPNSLSQPVRQQLLQMLRSNPLPDLPAAASQADRAVWKEQKPELIKKRRRWEAVDSNKDGKLTKEEFKLFLFPDEFDSTRGLLVDEELERLDTDADGRVSLAEFLADLWNPTQGNEEAEPDWVENERQDFRKNKDKNGDGFLDKAELEAYMYDNVNRAELFTKEADHLLSEGDGDKDGSLSREEMLKSVGLLAASAATNFGEHLREDL